ncbi:hypothetical protein V2J09_001390 [Rumex salicifolius]
MGRIPPSGLSKGMSQALAINSPKAEGHLPATRSPSCPQEVLLGKLLILLNTTFLEAEIASTLASKGGNIGHDACGCFFSNSLKVSWFLDATPDEVKTLTAVVKCPL